MSDTIIRVENLGKKYIIGHQTQQAGWEPNRGNYVALRDVVANGMKSFGKRLIGKERRRSYTTEEFWALKDINFEIKRSEVVGIIGRNGAGKSTLLKILSRITEPTTGRIELGGRVASLLEVGTGFHPELTGRENIYLNGSILGMSRLEIRKKFDEIVAFAEVEKFLDTPVKRYSSGMYVRLAFAVAAHLEPEILVVDEVLAVGDSAFQKKCLGKMEDVATNEGRTVLFVSHNMATLQKICQKAFVFAEGKIIFTGSQTEAISEYLADSTQNNDLSKRSDHKGDGRILIWKIEIVNLSGKLLRKIPSGTDIEIRFYYQRNCKRDIQGLQLSLHLSHPIYGDIAMINNRATGDILDLRENNRGFFSCQLKKLPLTAGRYYLKYTLMPDYGISQEYLDLLPNAIELDVVESDFYGSGHSITSEFGCLLLDGKWQ